VGEAAERQTELVKGRVVVCSAGTHRKKVSDDDIGNGQWQALGPIIKYDNTIWLLSIFNLRVNEDGKPLLRHWSV
jgi:hypothetical protein